MAFDRHQSTSAYSLFPNFQPQASAGGGLGNNGNLASTIAAQPSVSMQEQSASSIMSRPLDDHLSPMHCAQINTRSRRLTENTDCDGETGLQRLVSNILDEADSQDSFFNNGSLPICNPLWSPLSEEHLEFSQSKAKTQPNHVFPTNYVPAEALGKTQRQSANKDLEKFFQQPDGLTVNQQWLLNVPNGDRFTQHPQKVPSGRLVPSTGGDYLSQIQQAEYEHRAPDRDRVNAHAAKNFPDHNDVMRTEIGGSSLCFNPNEDFFNQTGVKPISTDSTQDISQLISSLQSLMAGEDNSFFPNTHRQRVLMQYDDAMGEQRKIPTPAVSSQSTPGVQSQKLLGRECERNGGVNNQTLKYHALSDLYGFSPRNTSCYEQPKQFFSSSTHPSKVTVHRQNASISNINQYAKQPFQHAKIQEKTKQDNKKMLMPSVFGENIPAGPSTSTDMRAGGERRGLSQSLYFEPMGGSHFKRSNGENAIFSGGNTQQLLPFMCAVNDPRRVPMNSSSSRPTLPYGRATPGMDVGDLWSVSESTFNSCSNDVIAQCVENTYHGMASTMATPLMVNQGGHMLQLNVQLDECYEQWKFLEKEREKIQTILSMTFPGKKTAAVMNANIPKTPPNPTRVDHLIIKHLREHYRVASLFERIQCLCNISLPANIHSALRMHNTAVCITQARRQDEMAGMLKHQRQRAQFTESKDTLLLAISLQDLATATSKLRMALWCTHLIITKNCQGYPPHTEEPLPV